MLDEPGPQIQEGGEPPAAPDPDSSPFEAPSYETVEKGIDGPWTDEPWESDNTDADG